MNTKCAVRVTRPDPTSLARQTEANSSELVTLTLVTYGAGDKRDKRDEHLGGNESGEWFRP